MPLWQMLLFWLKFVWLFLLVVHDGYDPSLFQRAWLLKLLAIELHAGDMTSTNHRETCQSILAHMFGQNSTEYSSDHSISHSILRNDTEDAGKRTITRSKVMLLIFDFSLVMYFCFVSHVSVVILYPCWTFYYIF